MQNKIWFLVLLKYGARQFTLCVLFVVLCIAVHIYLHIFCLQKRHFAKNSLFQFLHLHCAGVNILRKNLVQGRFEFCSSILMLFIIFIYMLAICNLLYILHTYIHTYIVVYFKQFASFTIFNFSLETKVTTQVSSAASNFCIRTR